MAYMVEQSLLIPGNERSRVMSIKNLLLLKNSGGIITISKWQISWCVSYAARNPTHCLITDSKAKGKEAFKRVFKPATPNFVDNSSLRSQTSESRPL